MQRITQAIRSFVLAEIEMAFPELTREQMRDRGDLAGIARVVSVGRASPDSPILAKLQFLQIAKGILRDHAGFVYVRLHDAALPRLESGLAS